LAASGINTSRRLYGRKQTRPPGREGQEALDALLPKLQISVSKEKINPKDLFSFSPAQTWLEIGFGSGEHLAALMRRHPDHAFIGAEPFINGMSAFLKNITGDPHGNIRIWMDDAILLTEMLADDTLDGIYILNPDPWPKKRHRKRRIVSPENLDRFARLLKPGGQLIMSTDVGGLAGWMVTQAANHPAFEWTAERAADWQTPPPDWIATRYEKKGLGAGRKQIYLLFIKSC
jgi:tRNA (guanine-N7-)-methyltransferase